MESIPSPLHRSHIKNPSKTHYSQFFFLFSLFNFSTLASNLSDSAFKTTYTSICNDVVPFSIPSDAATLPAASLRFQSGYFSGGDPVFNRSTSPNYSKRMSFHAASVRATLNDAVFELRGQILLEQPGANDHVLGDSGRLLRNVYPGFGVPHLRAWQWIRVRMRGFWSQSSGKLCMIGTGPFGKLRNANVVLKLSYPLDLTVLNSLITGTVESFDDKNSLHYFEPISVLAVSQSSNYKFTVAETGNQNGCVGGSDLGESLPLKKLSEDACNAFHGHMDNFELVYESHCGDSSCNPLGGGVDKLPKFMYLYGMRCSERLKVRMILGFPGSSYNGHGFPFYPNTTLISEGVWDEKENRLCAVACRILNYTEAWGNPYVGDCSIKLTIRFPAALSLRNRNTALGQIWSDKAVGEPGYFSKIGFQGSLKVSRGLHGFQYNYTEIDRVRKSCAEKMSAIGKEKMHPDGYSFHLRFDMLVTNSIGQKAQGYSAPLFVGDQIYDDRSYGVPVLTMGNLNIHRIPSGNHSSLLNISYIMTIHPPPGFKFGGEVSSNEVKIDAEGMYDRNTGLLCMAGCRHLRSIGKILTKNELLDCEITVNVQFSPWNAKGGESVKGTIESNRHKSDPYYFDPLQLSSFSISPHQAEASIWRMDFEIIMVLISNTLACVFIGLQLFHVKKHPDVLPYISIVMLLVITLGHMIPLILNFEALFVADHGQQNAFLGSGGWHEVNEVVVRMVTMIAFLLELRLLQLTWSSRQGEGSQPGLLVSEKKVLYMTLPMYVGGGVTAWLVHIWKISHQETFRPFRLSRHRFIPRKLPYQPPPSLWEDFKSYAGLLQDGFLLPQILFNILFNSEGKALASSFYVGTTIVRILPHAYDLYRARSSTWYLDLSYIYANHRMDFYSTAWDIIIPCGGLLFALLIYIQQRCGSRRILPKRLRESFPYEKVSVIGNDDL